jgi:hypothetical protein
MKNTIALKLTAAIAIAGKIRKAGSIVEVDEALAKNLLHRGKVRLPDASDELAPKTEADTSDVNSDGDGTGGDTDTAKPSDGLTVKQLRKALKDAGVNFPADANQAALAAMVDALPTA